MEHIKIIALTHRHLQLDEIGMFHLENEERQEILSRIKKQYKLEELMYLSTCNRVEYLFVTKQKINDPFIRSFMLSAARKRQSEAIEGIFPKVLLFEGMKAVEHLFRTISSLDSLVLGEREIITQIRSSFEQCKGFGLTGDMIRLLIEQSVKTAKRVYTETGIGRHAVSVSSLAFREVQKVSGSAKQRVLFIGAGKTITAMAKMFKKKGFNDLTFFNRTYENASKLAGMVDGKAYMLKELKYYAGGFDVLVSCTGSGQCIITRNLYKKLLHGETGMKTLIDLAVPADIDRSIGRTFNLNLIGIEELQPIARTHLHARKLELRKCNQIIRTRLELFVKTNRQRQIELAMSQLPESIKQIKEKAVNEVFTEEIKSMDPASRNILEKVLAYIASKSIAVPMKIAREALAESA